MYEKPEETAKRESKSMDEYVLFDKEQTPPRERSVRQKWVSAHENDQYGLKHWCYDKCSFNVHRNQ